MDVEISKVQIQKRGGPRRKTGHARHRSAPAVQKWSLKWFYDDQSRSKIATKPTRIWSTGLPCRRLLETLPYCVLARKDGSKLDRRGGRELKKSTLALFEEKV